MKRCNVFWLMAGFIIAVAFKGTAVADGTMTELSGELFGTLTAEKPYLVVGDVYVPPGSTVSIEAGAVILFSGFSGLHVQGTLYAKGTARRPVLFTSQFDTTVSATDSVAPAPFDWNGIDVYESAVGTEFYHCTVRYSVYGIRSQTEHIKIISSYFSKNGKSDFSIREERKVVTPERPFSYSVATSVLPKPTDTAAYLQSQESRTAPVNATAPDRKKRSTGRQVLRYAGVLVGAGCGAYSAISYVNGYRPAADEFNNLSDLDEYEKRTKTSGDWETAKKKRNDARLLTGAGAGAALLGLLAFSLSFTF